MRRGGWVVQAHLARAQRCIERYDFSQAVVAAVRALSLAEQHGLIESQARALLVVARVANVVSRETDALNLALHALRLARLTPGSGLVAEAVGVLMQCWTPTPAGQCLQKVAHTVGGGAGAVRAVGAAGRSDIPWGYGRPSR